MKALVIANGSVENVQFYREEVLNEQDYDFIICADGGIQNCLKLGIVPHMVMGDLDSAQADDLKKIELEKVEVIKYPKEKDETDTELVLDYLVDHGYEHITMIGCLGNRMDHSFANIYLLKKLLQNNVYGEIVDEKNIITLIDKEVEVNDKKGSTISLLPLSDRVEGICSTGLYYQLNDSSMVKEKPYGISNVIVSDCAKVEIKSGEVLLFISRD